MAQGTVTPRRKRANTRERLLAGGFEVFAEHGIRHASIEAICDRAGFTRGAFYSNFSSKEELFLAIYDREIETRAQRLDATFRRLTREDVLGGGEAWLLAVGLSVFATEHAQDEQWFLLESEVEIEGMRDHAIGAALAAARAGLLDKVAAVVEATLARLALTAEQPPEDAVRVIARLYQATLRDELLTAPFPDAKRAALRALPELLGPMLRLRAA